MAGSLLFLRSVGLANFRSLAASFAKLASIPAEILIHSFSLIATRLVDLFTIEEPRLPVDLCVIIVGPRFFSRIFFAHDLELFKFIG